MKKRSITTNTKNMDEDKDMTSDIEDVNESDGSELDDGFDVSGDNDSDQDEVQESEKKESKKRKLKSGRKAGKSKRIKRQAKEVKPLTTEELIALHEAETQLESNLLKFMIERMLSDVKPKKSVKRYLPSWLESFKQVLFNLEDDKVTVPLNDTEWLKDSDITLPLKRKDDNEKSSFMFMKPVDVFTIGAYDLSCPLLVGTMFSLDIAVVMPKKFFLRNDKFNLCYHFKRTLYLCKIATYLKSNNDLCSENSIRFSYMSGDPNKPLLIFRPSGKLSSFVEIRLYPIPEANTFFNKRFIPSKNNIRAEWWGLKTDSEALIPTQNYNASILEDLVLKDSHDLKKSYFEKNQHLRDAFILLRVWLKQRELNQGFGSFNDHIAAMMMAYLVQIGKINKFMSSYQIIRHIWLYLEEADWTKDGPSICITNDNDIPTKNDFHSHYDVVFIDSSGYFNIASRLNKYVYLKVKEEAGLAVKHLNNYEINNFKVLFMTKMPILSQYDIVVNFSDSKELLHTIRKKGDQIRMMDFCGNPIPEVISLVTNVWEKGMGHRLLSIMVRTPPESDWDLNTEPPLFVPISFGLTLDPATALALIDKGPQPNEPGHKEFREFWGKKCELRRFKDSSVCESVVWGPSESTIEDRRCIVYRIVMYLLRTKLQLRNASVPTMSFQKMTECKSDGTHFNREEECRKIHLSYEDLSRQLRDLSELPLQITSVHCISPVYRFTDPHPPQKPFFNFKDMLVNDPVKGKLFPENGKAPYRLQYISPIDLVLQMAVTKNWPEDVKAGKRLITAFNIAISEALNSKYNLSCQITTDNVIINKDGYMFRLFLGYSKEIALLKLKISELGMKQYLDTPESLELEKTFINLPRITGALYRLSEEHSSFSPATCLAKRWFSAQLIDNSHFPEILIELLMASLYLTPQPFKAPTMVLPSFLRFLTLISTTDWALVPVIVNLNSLLSREEINEIEEAFNKNRSTYPALFLATPYDKNGSVWSKEAPTLPMLLRLSELATIALNLIESTIHNRSTVKETCLANIFKAPMSCYDVVIKLKTQWQNRLQEKFRENVEDCQKQFQKKFDRNPVLPILGFNPVDLYVTELRNNYSNFALFYYNPHGGLEIGILFKPDFLKNTDFKIKNANARKPITENEELRLHPNLDSLLDGFKILGGNLVQTIELRNSH